MKLKALVSAVKVGAKGTVEMAKIHSPKILLGLGIAGVTIGFVWAIANTAKKLDNVCEKHVKSIDHLKELYSTDDGEELTEGEKKELAQETIKEKAHFIFDIVKTYIGPVSITVLGVASILMSHHILNARYLGACTALQTVTEAYSQYREKVINDQGIEKDLEYSSQPKTEVVVDENGDKYVKTMSSIDDVNTIVRVFSECTSDAWRTVPDYNYAFISGQLNAAKREGFRRGHLFLNDILKMLGLAESEAGCYLGWNIHMGDEIVVEYTDVSNLENLKDTVNKSNAWTLYFKGMRVLPPTLEKEDMLQPYRNAVEEYRRAMVEGGVLHGTE